MPQNAVQDETKARKTAPFPHHYEVSLEGGPHGWGVLTAPPRRAIVGGPPPQFEGKEEWWSPEHLLLSAVSLCMMTTFKVFAAKHSIDVARYTSQIKGMLDKGPGGLSFTSIVVHVDLSVKTEDTEKALKLLEEAKHYCIVGNALRIPVDLRTAVTAAP